MTKYILVLEVNILKPYCNIEDFEIEIDSFNQANKDNIKVDILTSIELKE